VTLGVAETDVVLEGLADTRERTLDLTAPLSDAEVEAQHSPLMSPLAWDLAHIAAYEDLWLVHRYGDRPLLHEDLAATYDAFETPRSARGDIELLDRQGALEYLVNQWGADHVVVGTDYPYDMGYYKPVSFVEGAKLTRAQKDLIIGGNAAKLLNLRRRK